METGDSVLIFFSGKRSCRSLAIVVVKGTLVRFCAPFMMCHFEGQIFKHLFSSCPQHSNPLLEGDSPAKLGLIFKLWEMSKVSFDTTSDFPDQII